jgi:hypothetical protein
MYGAGSASVAAAMRKGRCNRIFAFRNPAQISEELLSKQVQTDGFEEPPFA